MFMKCLYISAHHIHFWETKFYHNTIHTFLSLNKIFLFHVGNLFFTIQTVKLHFTNWSAHHIFVIFLSLVDVRNTTWESLRSSRDVMNVVTLDRELSFLCEIWDLYGLWGVSDDVNGRHENHGMNEVKIRVGVKIGLNQKIYTRL